MEPLLGGKLVNPPPSVRDLWDTAPKRRSPADWALHWLWNKPEVSVALSGMSTMEQVHQNVAAAEVSRVGSLTEEELALVERVRDRYNELCPIPCTQCRYCMPCPNGVDIPLNFSLYNDTFMFKDSDIAHMIYTQFTAPEQRASNCAECGECEEHCPQHLEIREELKKVHARLSQG
jgi:hypothetical protein